MTLKFLSTLPARGATLICLALLVLLSNFYPRSPRGERLFLAQQHPHLVGISIHAPREGSDPNRTPFRGYSNNFYPRSPRGERLEL